MSRPVLYLEDDLSDVRLAVDGATQRFEAPPQAEAPEDPLEALTLRAEQIAQWVSQRCSGPLTLCVGVRRALCERVRAPSAAPLVVKAALAQRSDEEEQRLAWLTVEPIASAERRGVDRRDRSAAPLTVLELPAAAVRLAMDELDRRGLACDEAITLWHALLRTADELDAEADKPGSDAASDQGDDASEGLRAVAASLPQGVVVWAFGEGPRLQAAGSARAPSVEAAASRLLLDWMSWCAQLERAPQRALVQGVGAEALASRLGSAFDAVEARAEEDPLDGTLARLSRERQAPAAAGPYTGARLTSLTTRPSRRHRSAAMWLSAAALLLAAAGGTLGLRSLAWTRQLRSETAALREEIRQRAVEAVAPSPLPPGDTVRAMLASLEEARQAFDPPQPPPPPLPIRRELAALVEAVASVPEAKLARVSLEKTRIGDPTGVATVLVPSLEAGEKVQLAVQEKTRGGAVRWTGQFMGAPPAMTLRLTASRELSP